MLDNSEFKILIVDDEPLNIEVVIGFLEPHSYKLFSASNGKDAIKGAFKIDFDLILLDINMPKIDGFEVCKRLKNDSRTKDIPIVFLSAYDDIGTITKALEIGGADYISKPFNGLELIARVNTQIQLRKYIKELKRKQDKLAHLASIDIHTQLPNRLRFMSKLRIICDEIESNPTRLVVASIQIDNINKINNLYGSKYGDKVISKVAKVLKDSLREDDTPARIMGAEFAVILPNSSLEAAKSIIKKFYAKIKNDIYAELAITCSIGLTEYNAKDDYEIFFNKTESIMSYIKDNGGDMISSHI